jgi:hypothetical protein
MFFVYKVCILLLDMKFDKKIALSWSWILGGALRFMHLWVFGFFFALAIYDIALCVMRVFTTQMKRDKLFDGWAWIDIFHLFV